MNTEFVNDLPLGYVMEIDMAEPDSEKTGIVKVNMEEFLKEITQNSKKFSPMMILEDNSLTYHGENCSVKEVQGENPHVTLFIANHRNEECVGFRIDAFSQFCEKQGMAQIDMLNKLKEFYELDTIEEYEKLH